ncbi:unnamed protein product [Meganyctiphanes norvegica]|uniref:Hyaluronidase n=1 Tax=Meganyctiphanes norvegica TaxID=48144 RepID=A0AAV2RI37_MEGNR
MARRVGVNMSFLFLLLMSYAGVTKGNQFKVYWNAPTERCLPYNISFNLAQYGIIQNTNDRFYGDKVTIFYSPGMFPKLPDRNGGIPQNGSITAHIKSFIKQVHQKMPLNFTGVAILDWETYFPSYQMSNDEYKSACKNWVRQQHPNWTDLDILNMAISTFNHSAKEYFEIPLILGKELRPNARWGYYHEPYCGNWGPYAAHCGANRMDNNDKTKWLYDYSGALFPSIYIYKNSGWSPYSRRRNTKGRLSEAMRVRRNSNKTGIDQPILPYFWYRYHDDESLLEPLDVVNTLGLTKMYNLEGAVVWGAGWDVDSPEKCQNLKNYIDVTLGPLVQYLQGLKRSKLRRALGSRTKLEQLLQEALPAGHPVFNNI